MESKNLDLAIIGGGPGGYVAAIRAAKSGLKVSLIEKDNLGGVCLNSGCIPTKTLYHTALMLEEIKKAAAIGIEINSPKLDFTKTIKRKDDIIEMQRKGIAFHLKNNGIELIKGMGKIVSSNKIKVKDSSGKESEVIAKNIIIATGSSAASVPPFDLSQTGIMDNTGILSLSKLLGSLLIVGAGVVGCEFANIFSTFGTKVTMVELLPGILATEDEDVSSIIHKTLKARGIDIFTSTKVEKLDEDNSIYTCKLSGDKEIKVEKILISVGRKPNSAGIGLEDAGIETDQKGFIKVDSHLRTNISNVYAIGDVIGNLQLAHVASEEGKIAAGNIAGKDEEMKYNVIPWAVFTFPEIGTVGMTEAQAKKNDIDVSTGSFPFSSSGKAYITGETEGFVKIVTDKQTGEILGAQLIGPRASEMVHEIAVAMKGEVMIDDLAKTVHSHPTLSEAVMEAAEDCFGIATHKA